MEVLDRALDPVGDDHRPGFAADLAMGQHLRMEVIHHDLRLEADRVVISLDVAPQLLAGPFRVELGVVLHPLGELVVALDRRVVTQHIQDEPLLDRLFHAVGVKGVMLDRTRRAPRVRVIAKISKRLVFGGCGKGEVAGVGEKLVRLHQVD